VSRHRAVVWFATAALVGCVRAALPESSGAPIRLVAEAEDFRIVRGAWRVVPWGENLFASTFAATFLSRKACLGTPETLREPAIATLDMTLPAAGVFTVLARYEQPWNFAVPFDLEIEQRGRRVFRGRFGRLADPKLWMGGEETPMKRFGWGGGDNIVWQRGGTVPLGPGQARLRLIAQPQDWGAAPAHYARRNVDVIVLTNDTAGLEAQKKTRYLPLDGWLVQDGDLYVRFTNPRDGLGPVVPLVAPYARGQHSPYYVHVRDWPETRVLKSGRLVSATPYVLSGPRSTAVRSEKLLPILDARRYASIPPGEYLAPGETSGWAPMGGVVDALNDSLWMPGAIYRDADAKDKRVDLEMEFAVPDGRGGLRPFRKLRVRGEPAYLSPLALEIPGDVLGHPRVRTQLEVVESLARAVAAFPKHGRAPQRFPIYGLMGFSDAMLQKDALGREATKLALLLGDDTLTATSGPWTEPLGVPQRRSLIATHWPIEKVKRELAAARARGTADSIAIVSYGDETRIEPARISDYAETTRLIERELGPGVRTGMNYPPHANYMVDAIHFVRPFREGALTLPWSEDYAWQVPEFSPQVTGYVVSGFRAGALARDLPIMMYVMPHSPGNTPRDFRLSFYSAVAHGARLVNLFCASPLASAYTENYVSDSDLGMWRAIYDAVHDTGEFEDYVLDSRVKPARVGLLLSATDEMATGDSNSKGGIHNQERKAVYYALRHAQVPVDFVTEDDVIEGRAKDMSVLYVTQQFLHSNAVAALSRWVEAGGTLVALVGGGFTDELGRDDPATHALYGVAEQEIWKDPALPMVLAKQDLPPAVRVDRASWAGVSAPVLVWKQSLKPSDGKVVGTFGDGKPAAIEKAHGKGRALLFGFFPGMAYLKSGLPLRPVDRGATNEGFNHFLPTAMDVGLRRALVDAFLPAGFARPVETSEPLVEATLLETPASGRIAVPLMNYTGKPLASVSVTLRGVLGVRSVRSVERRPLHYEATDGALTITLPLDVADMLLVAE
jgi:hypothetical protein